jgi:Zn finger protein HypA/HybF involved in hydrogenase expression
MAKKKNNQEEVVVEEPVVAQTPAEPVEVKKWVVNCHRCGAALNVEYGNVVYMCPVCNNLFRVRKGEKIVKDVTRTIVAEAYVNVHKGADEQ